MGRTGQTIRSRSSPQRSTHASTRPHPYQSSALPARCCPPGTQQHLSPGPQTLSGRSLAASWPKPCVSPAPVVQSPESTVVSADSAKLADEGWSPFDSPLVQQCLATRTQSLPSLLEHKERTPMYRPYAAGSRPSRNPAMFATTYAGHAYAGEQITVRVMDVESGEYLARFPIYRRDM